MWIGERSNAGSATENDSLDLLAAMRADRSGMTIANTGTLEHSSQHHTNEAQAETDPGYSLKVRGAKHSYVQ